MDIHRFRLADSIDHEKCILVSKDVPARAGQESELGLDGTVWVRDLFRMNREMVHPRSEAAQQRFVDPSLSNFPISAYSGEERTAGQLCPLMHRHPLQKPRV